MELNQILQPTQAKILQTILRLWHDYPELRFGQLIDAFSGTCTHNATCCAKLFFIPDEELLKNLNNAELRHRLEMETPR